MLSDAGKNASSPLWEGRQRRGVKIVKAERKAEGENEVFGFGFAEAHPVLSKDKQSQTNSGQEEIVKNCSCEKIPGKTMITRFSEEPGPFLR